MVFIGITYLVLLQKYSKHFQFRYTFLNEYFLKETHEMNK